MSKIAPDVKGTTIVAKPGDDLGVLISQHRTVKLAAGTYTMTQPLVLEKPVNLVAERDATLLFQQSSDQPPWPAAITVHRSHTTLDGFAIRFDGAIRWQEDVAWGPSVIGVTSIQDNSHPDPRVDLTFANLDIEGPAASSDRPGQWSPAVRLFRLINARSGRLLGNTLKGGTVEFFQGPWEIIGNDFRGTRPGTVSSNVFGAHNPHDLLVKRNRARSMAPNGKTWRFLVMTGRGANDRIEDNDIVAIGARDDDTIPWSNEPEVILTESYHLHFEGKPAAISADGLIVSLGEGRPLGQPMRVGSVVAVTAGEKLGVWRRVSQVLDRVTFLLDEPLPPRTDRIVIASGFVGESFCRNRVDSRGGSRAANLVLAGNHFGTQVRDNHLLGAGDSFQITAYPSESPGIWGWSHAPFLGGTISGNIIEDAEGGAILGVLRSEYTKSSRGRTYFTARLTSNTIRWSSEFLAKHQGRGAKLPPGLTIGYRPASDPTEQIIVGGDNRLDAPHAFPQALTMRVHDAIYNGKTVVNKGWPLPAPAEKPVAKATPAGRGGS